MSEDRWQFDECPENGPAIVALKDGSVQVAWVTPLDGKEAAPLALNTAGSLDGKSFTPRSLVATGGAARHVQIAAAAEGTLTLARDGVVQGSWRLVRLARGTAAKAGRSTFNNVAPADEGEAVYPVVAVGSGGTVVAWVRMAGGVLKSQMRVESSTDTDRYLTVVLTDERARRIEVDLPTRRQRDDNTDRLHQTTSESITEGRIV